MEKNAYYISVGSRGISQIETATPFELEIEATEDEIKALREIFNEMYSDDWVGFFRAHVPVVQYHHDQPNDLIDQNLINVYKMLHKLGTPETKQHIESMGVLNNRENKGYDWDEGHPTM
ncbi:MAG TPA: hydrolase [Bacillus bacterium]|nr:hydrolase [Bacillus sp. (in: firmicutes)]